MQTSKVDSTESFYRILLVEDDLAQQRAIAANLRQEGYTVVVLNDGRQVAKNSPFLGTL